MNRTEILRDFDAWQETNDVAWWDEVDSWVGRYAAAHGIHSSQVAQVVYEALDGRPTMPCVLTGSCLIN
jgi:hypothetical protein